MGIQIVKYDSSVAAGSVILPISVKNKEADARALYYGSRLADRVKRDLIIVHAVHEPAHMPGLYRRLDPQAVHVPLSDLALNICRRRIESLQSNHPELKSLENPALFVIPGLPATRISQIAKSTLACCIVMQKSERSTFGRLMHTPISDIVNKQANCPVVLIDSGNAEAVSDPQLLDISRFASSQLSSGGGRVALHTPA